MSSPDAPHGVSPSTPALGARPGDVVAGRWRVEEVIGKGGFGLVVRAAPVSGGRPVAIKLLRPELLTDARVVKRFLREASLVQRLEHPNTVRLLDVGQTDGGVPFLVFELLAGRPLDQVLRAEGTLEPERVARIAAQVLKSLGEAHAKQVVHRDLKPANVFLSEYQSDRDHVKVLDFGIGKALDGSGQTVLTQAGRIVGTPSYFAPERLRGEGSDTPAADLYALGLIMAELLSGRVVVTGPSFDAICAVHLAAEPIALPPEVAGSPLAGVIRRAVEKDPARRFGSAAEMLAALQPERAAADLVPAPSGEASTSATAAPRPRLSRRAVIVVVALAVVIFAAVGTGAGVLAAWLASPPPPSWGSPERIEQRLRLGGWWFNRQNSDASGARANLYFITNTTGQGGVVVLYELRSLEVATETVRGWRAIPACAVVQEARWVLIAELASARESELLLADLLAERPPPAQAPPPIATPTVAPAPTVATSTPAVETWPWLTADFIDERLRLDGWTTGREGETHQASAHTWTLSLSRPPAAGGTVILYRFFDLTLASSLEGSYSRVPSIAVVREGTTILLVNAQDGAESQRVLQFILAGRP